VDRYSRHITLHREVDIDLLAVGTDDLTIKVRDKRRQQVPWTAIAGIFGCHLTGEKRGFRGTIIVRFKGKNFACSFTTPHILVKDDAGSPLSFEDTWNLLKTHVPEDLPFLEMRDFSEVKDLSQSTAMVEAFVNRPPLIEVAES
jgi:hypothetical protein